MLLYHPKHEKSIWNVKNTKNGPVEDHFGYLWTTHERSEWSRPRLWITFGAGVGDLGLEFFLYDCFDVSTIGLAGQFFHDYSS